MNRKGSAFRPIFGAGGGITTDEGGAITQQDESATDPEMEFKNILNALNKNTL